MPEHTRIIRKHGAVNSARLPKLSVDATISETTSSGTSKSLLAVGHGMK